MNDLTLDDQINNLKAELTQLQCLKLYDGVNGQTIICDSRPKPIPYDGIPLTYTISIDPKTNNKIIILTND